MMDVSLLVGRGLDNFQHSQGFVNMCKLNEVQLNPKYLARSQT